ncbi:DUF1810 domain-containing protein [Rhizobium sp. SAFR-030]|uniref:DUF1810 domain-containing protein n=1 Tax=Rhizobium sp. SAFR-030 TaxID=3387277 RepID=UPI003F80187F
MTERTARADDTHDLARFVSAQESIYSQALRELIAGRKHSHWMWFIFPQIEGLGRSATARHYAISGRAEAQAYAAHPLLGPRLLECTQAMLTHAGRTAQEIFGSPDDLKFRSSMTLFAAISEKGSPFERALDQFCDGRPDGETLARL